METNHAKSVVEQKEPPHPTKEAHPKEEPTKVTIETERPTDYSPRVATRTTNRDNKKVRAAWRLLSVRHNSVVLAVLSFFSVQTRM